MMIIRIDHTEMLMWRKSGAIVPGGAALTPAYHASIPVGPASLRRRAKTFTWTSGTGFAP